MERKSLLSVLSPQLQALVEASLGEKIQSNSNSTTSSAQQQPTATATAIAPAKQSNTIKVEKGQDHDDNSSRDDDGQCVNTGTTVQLSSSTKKQGAVRDGVVPYCGPPSVFKLNPSELFVLRHPESPGFVVRERFLGSESACAARNALVELAKTATFHKAKVGHGEHLRNERAVRGDRIHWLKRPSDLNRTDDSSIHPAIVHLMKRVESVVYGVKSAIPDMDIRNVTSTQFAIFPGDGSRFVKHSDTYSTAHRDEAGRSSSSSSSSDGLVRILTCVYYLNESWVADHGGQLRVYVKGGSSSSSSAPANQWDIPPQLDTLVVFRSLDVEHEVLPTFHERMALTIWYYGRVKTQQQVDPLAMLKKMVSVATSTMPVPAPVPQQAIEDSSKNDTIFVAIPSYRDPECRHTVDDLLLKAKNPARIHIGIYLQEDEEDSTRQYLENKYSAIQVRVKWVDYRRAAGPCVARAEAQTLWGREKYYLQIDSHMRFRDGWDAFLIDQLEKCPSSNPILTTYPLGYTLPNNVSTDIRPTLLCASSFDDHGILRQASKTLAKTSPFPLPSSFWAAGFTFSSSRVIQEVPYDESLRFLFFGEEASMSARMWTSGWDFFTPGESVIYHLWTRSYRRVFQEIEDQETVKWRLASQVYVKNLLLGSHSNSDADANSTEEFGSGSRVAAGKYSLGGKRTLSEYQTHIGVSFEKQEVTWAAEWGNLDPIQFELSSKSVDVHAPV